MSLLSKFHFQAEEPTFFLNVPNEILLLMCDLNKSSSSVTSCKQIIVCVKEKNQLHSFITSYIQFVSIDAKLWIAFPKKSSGIKTDLDRMSSWSVFSATNWIPVSNVSIDETWTAIRFREKSQIKQLKRNQAIEERNTDGIDYVNRTVQPPNDVLETLSQHDGLLLRFNQLSFSHKREFIESIVSAKKKETRVKRIDNMINSLQKIKDKSK